MYPFDDGWLDPDAATYGARWSPDSASSVQKKPTARSSTFAAVNTHAVVALAFLITASSGVVADSNFLVNPLVEMPAHFEVQAEAGRSATGPASLRTGLSATTRAPSARPGDDLATLMAQARLQATAHLIQQGQNPEEVVRRAGERVAAWTDVSNDTQSEPADEVED